jgi:hypothetical protein
MANRSDFFSAKLPRHLKKMISLGEVSGALSKEGANFSRKTFAAAHAHHVAFKLRRNSANQNVDIGGE